MDLFIGFVQLFVEAIQQKWLAMSAVQKNTLIILTINFIIIGGCCYFNIRMIRDSIEERRKKEK